MVKCSLLVNGIVMDLGQPAILGREVMEVRVWLRETRNLYNFMVLAAHTHAHARTHAYTVSHAKADAHTHVHKILISIYLIRSVL